MKRRVRRHLLIAFAASVALLAGLLPLATPTSAAPPPLLWGAFPAINSGESGQQAVQRLETLAGRKLDTVRVFYRWDQTFPGNYENWLVSTGRTMELSVKAKRMNGTNVLFKDIANAAPGSTLYNQMVGWANKVKALGVPTFVTFNHEPEAEASRPMGTDVEFIAAWRKWVDVFRAQGVTNAKYMWIVTDYAYQLGSGDRRYAGKWYPGDAWVDGIASDAYNWDICRPGIYNEWKSLEYILDAQRRFGLAHPTKDLYVTEYGTVEDLTQPGRKGQWYLDAKELFKKPAYAQFKGVSLFERGAPGEPCTWEPDSSTSAAAGWKAWGQDSYYGGPGTITPPPPPPPPPPSDHNAVLVVANPAAPGTDATIKARLEGLGYTVTYSDDNSVTTASVASADVVLISQSADTNTLGSKLRDAIVPIVSWKAGSYGPMGFSSTAATDSGAYGKTTVTITNSAHPMAAGLSGDVVVTTTAAPLSWAVVGSGATVIAKVAGQPTLFVYAPGSAMVGLTAPACRVGIPLHKDAVPTLTTSGWKLFDTAVVYADDSC